MSVLSSDGVLRHPLPARLNVARWLFAWTVVPLAVTLTGLSFPPRDSTDLLTLLSAVGGCAACIVLPVAITCRWRITAPLAALLAVVALDNASAFVVIAMRGEHMVPAQWMVTVLLALVTASHLAAAGLVLMSERSPSPALPVADAATGDIL